MVQWLSILGTEPSRLGWRKQAMTKEERRVLEIQRLDYQPDGDYPLDLEIFRVSDLRRRVGTEILGSTHRYAFLTLLCVTRGACRQLLDFESIPCVPGSLLLVRQGMAHSFGPNEDWDGWMVLFRPEFLLPSSLNEVSQTGVSDLDGLPTHLVPADAEAAMVTRAIAQMHDDTRMAATAEDMHALLRYQLCALLTRMRIIHAQNEARGAARSPASQRFKEFELLVEKHFAAWHHASRYAERMGCSEKSLARATMDSVGMNPKAFISARVVLEAKRLLVHTELSVSDIAERIGFNDLSNFVKFFKREAECTSMEFRRRHVQK